MSKPVTIHINTSNPNWQNELYLCNVCDFSAITAWFEHCPKCGGKIEWVDNVEEEATKK